MVPTSMSPTHPCHSRRLVDDPWNDPGQLLPVIAKSGKTAMEQLANPATPPENATRWIGVPDTGRRAHGMGIRDRVAKGSGTRERMGSRVSTCQEVGEAPG